MSIRSWNDPDQQRRAEECKRIREAGKQRIEAKAKTLCKEMCRAVVEERRQALEAERLFKKKQAADAMEAAELLRQAIRLEAIATRLILENNPFQRTVVREARMRRNKANKLVHPPKRRMQND